MPGTVRYKWSTCLANGAATALKPEPAPCEMVQVASTRLCRTQGSSGRVVPSWRAVPQAGRASLHACGAWHCPSVRVVPVPCSSALLLPPVGNSPCVTAWQPRLPSQPQPARGIRSFDSSCLDFCHRGVGLGSTAKMKPVTWHGYGKALGSFPVQNNKRRVCPASAPSQGTCSVRRWVERGLPAAEAD